MVRTVDQLEARWRDIHQASLVDASITAFAEAERVMQPGESVREGPYRAEPYIREIQDSCSPNDPAHTVTVKGSSQWGKTTMAQNVVGYRIAAQPGPILWILPLGTRSRASKVSKMDPFFAGCRVVAEKVGRRSDLRRGAHSAQLIQFPGGQMMILGSGSTSSFRENTASLVILDDLDAFADAAEGDPYLLAQSRISTYRYFGGKVVALSKPTRAGASRISSLYEASSQGHFYIPCLACQHFQILWRKSFRYTEGKRHFECERCRAPITDGDRGQWLQRGEWRHAHPERLASHRGYHLWAAYTPNCSFEQLAENLRQVETERARGNAATEQTVLNEDWGEEFVPPSTAKLEASERLVLARRAPRIARTALPPVLWTAGADVQADRLESSIWAWSRDDQAWLWDHQVFHGSPELDRPWDHMFEWWTAEQVQCACVDARYRSTRVVERLTQELRMSLARGCMLYPTQGQDGRGLLWPRKVLPPRGSEPLTITTIRVDSGRAWLHGALLGVLQPGPGYVHLGHNIRVAQVKQLFGKRPKYGRGTQKRTRAVGWEDVPGRRHEVFDCAVYARAARDARSMWDPIFRAFRFAEAMPTTTNGSVPTEAPEDPFDAGVF